MRGEHFTLCLKVIFALSMISCVAAYVTLHLSRTSERDVQETEESNASLLKREPRESLARPIEKGREIKTLQVSSNQTGQRGGVPNTQPSFDSKTMKDEFARAARIFGIDEKAGCVSDRLVRIPPYGILVRKIETADGKLLEFDVATGQLRALYEGRREVMPSGLTKENAITKEEALDTVRGLLKELDCDSNLKAGEAYYRDTQETIQGDLKGAEWVSSVRFSYKGVPYFGSGVRVCVSAYSGRVLAYSSHPQGSPPTSMEEKFDANQASEKVRTFWANLSPDSPALEFQGEPSLAIALPNNFWTRDNGQPLTDAQESRLCWVVHVVPSSLGRLLVLYVDAQTGDICGGIG